MNTQSVAVFCGSREGQNKIFASHAKELGKLIAVLGLKLVYGGAKKG
jgi:predicted Rossmann-fold nucleotide-binding protein